jgi:hypothetical protein
MSFLKRMIPGQRSTDYAMPTQMQYQYKTRFAMLGTVGSGKSTVASAIVLTAMTLSSKYKNFYCRVLEGDTSRILADASNLRRGHFPDKTNPYSPYPPESGLLLTWQGTWGKKQVQIPICDVAGEDIQQMIRQDSRVLTQDAYRFNTQLVRYVRDAEGFLVAMPASRALMFENDQVIEKEYDASGRVSDPDVPLSRILNAIFQYKDESRGRRIKGIGVVITKWDLIAPHAARWGMDLNDPTGEGMRRFIEVCFPSTSMTLKPLVDAGKVHFFPSAFKVQVNEDGSIRKWPDGGDKIEVIQQERKPVYEEQSYVNLFNWLRSFAT